MLSALLASQLWALCLLTPCAAAEPTRLADDLHGPSALAALEGPLGGYRLVVAEADAERCLMLNMLGESILSRREVGRIIGPPPVGLAGYGERLLVLNERGLSLQPLEPGGEGARGPAGPVPIGPPAASDSWLFAPGRDGLLRGLLAAKRVGDLEAFAVPDGEPVAVAFSPEGYLALLVSEGDEAAFRLAFYDPERPAIAVASRAVEGLSRPVALAYATAGGATLLVLEAGGEAPGLYRLVTTPGSLARAELLAEIAEPTALVISPDGIPLVTTRGGELFRFVDLTPSESIPNDPTPND